MKTNGVLARELKRVSLRNVLLKRLIFTILTTLIVTEAPTVLTVASKRAGRRSTGLDHRSARSDSDSNIALGLTRKRGAFNKAIGMLADAAALNPDLAAYYHSLRKRVKGKGVNRRSSVSRALVDTSSEVKPFSHVDDSPFGETGRYAGSRGGPREEMPPRFTVGDMSFKMNAAIEHWANYYASTPGGRRTMMIGIERSNAYLEMARAEFRKAGVPEDLVWLAFVESVWNPQALSPAAAGGLWQFIPSTATDYGLRVQRGDDERNDPAKQTRVAATYLHDLYTIFGDWHLSMAAYNSGEPRVMGAIVKNGRADFWELYEKQLLPKETCDYVPKILASIKVAGEAEHYGLLDQPATSSFSNTEPAL